MCDLDQGQQVLASRQGIGQTVLDSLYQVDCCQPILVLLDSISLHSITKTFSEPTFSEPVCFNGAIECLGVPDHAQPVLASRQGIDTSRVLTGAVYGQQTPPHQHSPLGERQRHDLTLFLGFSCDLQPSQTSNSCSCNFGNSDYSL